MNAEKPIGIALIICDQIIDDKETNKKTLVGLFSTVGCKSFPAKLDRLCVFVSLTQLHGNVQIELKCHNENDQRPVINVTGDLNSTNPNTIIEIGFVFNQFCFPSPGTYTFEVWSKDEIILQRRFEVELLKILSNKRKII